jgi:hypothetical protein
MKRILLSLALTLTWAASLQATSMIPTTYQYVIGPYGFQDSGGELIDGLYGDLTPGVNLAAPNPASWVEFGGQGKVKFSFDASVTITNIVMSMARWEPAAVYLPDQLTVNDLDYSGYAGAFADMDRAAINLNGSWTGSDLTIFFAHSQYLFLDEISFQGTVVPEPATGTLSAVALISLFAARRRQSKK